MNLTVNLISGVLRSTPESRTDALSRLMPARRAARLARFPMSVRRMGGVGRGLIVRVGNRHFYVAVVPQ